MPTGVVFPGPAWELIKAIFTRPVYEIDLGRLKRKLIPDIEQAINDSVESIVDMTLALTDTENRINSQSLKQEFIGSKFLFGIHLGKPLDAIYDFCEIVNQEQEEFLSAGEFWRPITQRILLS